jgi:regulatory protein YycH of two-component signal transduction system YycFG
MDFGMDMSFFQAHLSLNKAVENHLRPIDSYEEKWRNFSHNHNSSVFLSTKKTRIPNFKFIFCTI